MLHLYMEWKLAGPGTPDELSWLAAIESAVLIFNTAWIQDSYNNYLTSHTIYDRVFQVYKTEVVSPWCDNYQSLIQTSSNAVTLGVILILHTNDSNTDYNKPSIAINSPRDLNQWI